MQSFRKLLISQSLGMYTRSQAKQFSNGYTFTHDSSVQEFHLKISDSGSVAKVEYIKGDDVLDLVHSYVPQSLRGKGIGGILAKSTFDYIDKNEWKMIVTCTFLKKVYEENEDTYKHLIHK